MPAPTASSVAPAQVTDGAEPLIADGSGILPVPAVVELLDDEIILSTGDPLAPLDPLAPTDDSDGQQAAAEPSVKPTGDLASLVAQFRGSETGSFE